MLGRNADAGILHRKDGGAVLLGHGDLDAAAAAIILHGVVAEVIEHLAENPPDAHDRNMLPRELEAHIPFLRGFTERIDRVRRKIIEIHRLALGLIALLLESGEIDDVVDQIDQALGLAVDVGRELLHLFRRHAALRHELGKAGDGRERRFELMRDVGGKFPAQRFTLGVLLRDRALLLLNALQERRELRIGRGGVLVVEIHLVDRADDALGRLKRRDQAQQRREHDDPERRRDGDDRRAHRGERAAEAQDRAVGAEAGDIHRLHAAAAALPDALPLAGGEGAAHLGAVDLVAVVRKLVVIDHAPVRADPCDAVDVSEGAEIVLPALHEPLLGIDRLLPEGGIRLVLRLRIAQDEKHGGREHKHQQSDEQARAEDRPPHPSRSSRR